MECAALAHEHGTRYPHSQAYADRHGVKPTDARRPQRAQAFGEHSPNRARHRSTPTRRAGMGRSAPFDVGQRRSMSSMTMNPPAASVARFAAVPDAAADHRQADYFLRLLNERCQLVEHRINRFRRAIALAEAGRATDHADALRRTMRIEEQDRQTLQGLIAGLQRRFAVGAEAAVPALSLSALIGD
jgi:hypothetical protein